MSVKPVEIEILMKDRLTSGLDKAGKQVDGLKGKATSANEELGNVQRQAQDLRNTISQLEAQMDKLRTIGQHSNPDLDQSQNIAKIEALQNQIKELEIQLKQLEESAENTNVVPPDIPSAKQQFNGLHMSIQQIARELPSLAMGPQMFFLAISNNLPIFADEVSRARKEYDLLVKSGQKGTPVWKQILSSLFSWQTALTTGIMLLVMYGKEITEWTKDLFSAKKGVEEFNISLKEMTEIEKNGRAEMVRTRFEIDTAIASLKNFTGNKEQEKSKVEELNRKYGEAFGYYDTIAQWYDILRQKSTDYIQTLFLQAKAQAMVNKAIEADEEVNRIKSQSPDEAESAMGFFGKMGQYMMQSSMAEAGQFYDAQAAIEKHNKEAYEELLKEAEGKRDGFLEEAKKLTDAAANIGKTSGIGGHVRPDQPKQNTVSGNEQKKRMEAEQNRAEELRNLRWDNEQADIDQMKESSEKRIRQIKLDYEKETASIRALEEKWKKEQGGRLTKEQSETIKVSYSLAQSGMDKKVKEVEADEVQKGREKLNKLLEEYKNYDQRRRDIDSKYREDMAAYNLELSRLKESRADTSDVESSISARTEKYKEEIASLEEDILRASDFYSKLFGDVSEKGYKALSDFYAQAKDVLSGAKVGSGGVSLSVPAKDENGNFVKKQVTVTVAEFERMQKRVKEIQKDLEKGNPFKAFKTSYDDLLKAIKKDGDISGALKDFNVKGKELTSTIRGWGDSLGAVFGDRFAQSINEMMTFVDGAMDMGTGIGQIFSGDIVGGITNTLSGLGSIISMFTSWKEKMEEMKREWYIAEIETNRAIRERNEEYAANQSLISDIIKDVELLNWLVEKGYAKPSSISVWEAQSEQLSQLQQDLKAEQAVYDDLWNKLQGSDAHWEWGNSLNGGSVTHSLRGMSAEQIELYYNQNKLSDAARDYYEAWVDSGKTVEELVQNIEECYSTMREMVMGVSFDSFLSNAKDAIREMRRDISKLGEFTEDTLAEAVLNAFMYQELSKMLQPLYDELSEAFINGTADKDYLSDWRERFEETMREAKERLDAIADSAGVDLDSGGGTSQSGKSGSFDAMTHDQGTKLEGLFVSGQMHWASIDERMEDVSEQMGVAIDHLQKIEENTGTTAKHLEEIKSSIKKMERDGIKVK